MYWSYITLASELAENISSMTGDGFHNNREFLGELNNAEPPWEEAIRKQVCEREHTGSC
jgi:hypothetical protein